MNRFERQARQEGYHWVAGVDEAGRGPLAGPVVAAAVVFPPDYENRDIDDSKRLSTRKREILYERIRADALAVGFGVIEADVIDRINILQASLQAMRDAVLELAPPPDYLLVDGCHKIPIVMPQEAVVHGDARSLSVAAASILAKVTRDRIMEIYHRQYPRYNFMKNKGYGTREHREAIRDWGCCKIHRRSFRLGDRHDVQEKLL